MENCLVTKLKASVNNPDLPVLEIMQQFTLDAITASGNSSMTDAQKWALNHFFYQIGAIDSSGIFAKMDYVFLPMICNENTAKALYDYKNNNVYTLGANNVFSNDGLTTASGVDNASSTIVNTYTYNRPYNNITYAVGFTVASDSIASKGQQILKLKGSPSTLESKYGITGSNEGSWVLWDGGVARRNANSEGTYGGVLSNDSTNIVAKVIGETSIISADTQSGTQVERSDLSTLILGSVPDAYIGVAMIGSALTADEVSTLAAAIKEFVTTYRSIA